MGIEAMVEQMTAAAGLHAKEKRDKAGAKCVSQSLPPCPPSRRGHVPSEGLAGMQIPVLMLYHDLMPDQPLPGDLTLSQLLMLLKDRRLPEGQTSIDFNMQFKTIPLGSGAKADGSSRSDDWLGTGVEPIPKAVLLETPSMATALQVFTGAGGLALLAEHLPLLYPELTRQGAPVNGGKDMTGPGGLRQDWDTVENSDDIYEAFHEAYEDHRG